MLQTYYYKNTFPLESGATLPELHIAYHTYGRLNKEKNNVIWICHALTANADVADWWKGLIGSQKAIDPEKHFIVCANILGSCYGTTGPLSVDPNTGHPYYFDFPDITIRDQCKAHTLLREHLGIDKIALLVGGSMGGYQALEWAVMEPEVIERLFLLATSARESAWGIALHTTQRLAIGADRSFGAPSPDAGAKGMKAARGMGLLIYRNSDIINKQQTDEDNDKTDQFKASSYINYQGDKLVNRFNAYSYWKLTKAMDSHNLARGRASNTEDVLASIQQPTLLIGISSDALCPAPEQRHIAAHLPTCTYFEMDSEFGHDGFLIETETIGRHLKAWLES